MTPASSSPASRSTQAPSSRRSSCRSARSVKNNSKSDPSNPTTLSDVYFRVGGPHVGKADVALEVNSDNVLIDHTWVWRADHGVEGFTDTERWNTNIGRNGVIVNGDNVTATGLFVEHFQQYNTDLERRERRHDPLPERAALRSPDPGGLDARRGRGLGRLQGRRPGARRTSSTVAASTSSTGTTRRSTPRTASRFPKPRVSSSITS